MVLFGQRSKQLATPAAYEPLLAEDDCSPSLDRPELLRKSTKGNNDGWLSCGLGTEAEDDEGVSRPGTSVSGLFGDPLTPTCQVKRT